jgi:molybdopterin converting factor small subunit
MLRKNKLTYFQRSYKKLYNAANNIYLKEETHDIKDQDAIFQK